LKILFVCMGNICRSPTAEGVLRHRIAELGLVDKVQIDSAGTHNYHPGSPPDERSQRHAQKRGYDLSALRARQIRDDDFETFDLILTMDWDNQALTEELCPEPHRHKVRRLAEFFQTRKETVVPDPYSGGAKGFELVLDMVEDAVDGLIRQKVLRAP
jgi:protein-tyrosine phosphatase